MHIALKKVATDSAVDVGTSSTLILSANPRRKFCTLVNSSNADMWLRFGSAAAVNSGVYLAAGGFGYEISRDNLWVDSIFAIHGGTGTKKLAILELE
jgi:hypothetical protein